MSFEEELAAAQAAAKAQREKQAPPKPRYKGGGRLKESIRVYCRPNTPHVLDFAISFDLVQQWLRWRENKPDLNLTHVHWTRLRCQFMTFKDAGMPAVLMRLEPYTFWNEAPKLRKAPNGWRFLTTVYARKIGVRPGMKSQKLDLIEFEQADASGQTVRGHVAIFPDEAWDHDGHIHDAYDILMKSRKERAQ